MLAVFNQFDKFNICYFKCSKNKIWISLLIPFTLSWFYEIIDFSTFSNSVKCSCFAHFYGNRIWMQKSKYFMHSKLILRGREWMYNCKDAPAISVKGWESDFCNRESGPIQLNWNQIWKIKLFCEKDFSYLVVL